MRNHEKELNVWRWLLKSLRSFLTLRHTTKAISGFLELPGSTNGHTSLLLSLKALRACSLLVFPIAKDRKEEAHGNEK